ncbi:hypothetical protein [Bradyrhizobium sp. ARR65]|uniref:hypothetical protein n=1 Tax=Bradyrhizobium sp. ARR65 TaxID=1040989 RepID=UPI000466F3CF|nr:hypothetical protein [Bradyrhizobium sp. ARR65]
MLKSAIRRFDTLFLDDLLWKIRKEQQLNEFSSSFDFKFTVHHHKNKKDLLAQLCDKYGSDKGEVKAEGHPYPWPSHTYTDFYSRLFSHCRNNIKRVFECGLGTNNPTLVSSMGSEGKPGASLRVWRDYFPNAVVYGADIDQSILFEEERIKTFHVDQLDPETIARFWKNVGVSDFEFMLDDGLHTFEAGACLFEHSIQHLSQDGIYVIEDVQLFDLVRYNDFFSKTDYVVDYVTLFRPNVALNDNSLVVIRRST